MQWRHEKHGHRPWIVLSVKRSALQSKPNAVHPSNAPNNSLKSGGEIRWRNQLQPHAYADDMQIYGFCNSLEVSILQKRGSACSQDVFSWTMANRLQLNASKPEIM